jgi:hypothetical protein
MLTKISIYSGIFWNAFMIDKTTMQIIATWDTAQMNDEEVDAHCDAFAGVLRRLGKIANQRERLCDLF